MEKQNSNLFVSLAKAQASFNSAIKDAANPFFKSKYADLSAVWDACKDAIKENGLICLQPMIYLESASAWVINSRIYDQAGQYIEGFTPIIATKQNDPQAFGSATTYARRYGLAALLGIVTEDDDAECGMGRDNGNNKKEASKQTMPEDRTAPLRHELGNLLKNSFISDSEQKTGLLKINVYTEEELKKKIAAVTKLIKEREEKSKVAA